MRRNESLGSYRRALRRALKRWPSKVGIACVIAAVGGGVTVDTVKISSPATTLGAILLALVGIAVLGLSVYSHLKPCPQPAATSPVAAVLQQVGLKLWAAAQPAATGRQRRIASYQRARARYYSLPFSAYMAAHLTEVAYEVEDVMEEVNDWLNRAPGAPTHTMVALHVQGLCLGALRLTRNDLR